MPKESAASHQAVQGDATVNGGAATAGAQHPAAGSTVETSPVGSLQPPAAAPAGPSASSPETSSPDPSLAALHFPVDDEPLENASCRGKCPAPYVLGITRKDRRQMEVRLHYCANKAAAGGDVSQGSVSITADIGGNGHASRVEVGAEGQVSRPILDCVHRLVESAPFAREHDVKRTTRFDGKVGK